MVEDLTRVRLQNVHVSTEGQVGRMKGAGRGMMGESRRGRDGSEGVCGKRRNREKNCCAS